MTAVEGYVVFALAVFLLLAAFTIPLGTQFASAHEDGERKADRKALNLNKIKDDDHSNKNEVDQKNDVIAPIASEENRKFKAKDFDMRNYDFEGDDIVLEVYGKAGRTTLPPNHPHDHDVYAYGLKVAEDAETETWEVADNHPDLAHDPSEAGNTWHAQTVVFYKNSGQDLDGDGAQDGCFDVEGVTTTSTMKGSEVIMSGTNRDEILAGATLMLELLVHPDEGDPYEPEIECNAIAIEVWDIAALGTKTIEDDD